MSDLLKKLGPALAGYSPSRKYLIAVSGGRDSMALLAGLIALGYRNLVICHLDHGLRGSDSRNDARFVAAQARRLGIAAEIARAQTRAYASGEKKSLELAARELRHAFLNACTLKHHCHRVFLAHHSDDQVETCLANFLRGTGAAGLAGMRPRSAMRGLDILRPLLAVSRQEISEFIASGKIPFREDASNSSRSHTRNRLRQDVIPAIERATGPSFKAAILRAAEILAAEEDWMKSLTPQATRQLSCRLVASLPLAARRRLVRNWLIMCRVQEPGFEETERVLTLLDTKTGPAKINLPGNIHARRRAGLIFLERP